MQTKGSDEAEDKMGICGNARLFTLGGKRVLMFSPQDGGWGYQNRNLFQSGYLLGDWQPGSRLSRKVNLWRWTMAMILCPAEFP